MSSHIQDRGLTEIAARAEGHTPTPWRESTVGRTQIVGADAMLIFEVPIRPRPEKTNRANRAFAVLAVNAFGPMKLALEAVEWVEVRSMDPATTFQECQFCGEMKEHGHAPSCGIAAALGTARGEPAK